MRKIHVGKGTVSIKSTIPRPNEPITITIPLIYEKGNLAKGKATMKCTYVSNEKPKEEKPPVNAKEASKAPAEKKPEGGSKDSEKPSSESKPSAGGSKENKADSSEKSKENSKEPEKSGSKNQHDLPSDKDKAGSGNNQEKGIPSEKDVREKEKTAPNDKEKAVPSGKGSPRENKTGNDKPSSSSSEEISIPNKNGKLKLNISKIEVHDLANTGWSMDAQDPAVEFIVGDKKFHTERYFSEFIFSSFPSIKISSLLE
jgi:hypothetical protein